MRHIQRTEYYIAIKNQVFNLRIQKMLIVSKYYLSYIHIYLLDS